MKIGMKLGNQIGSLFKGNSGKHPKLENWILKYQKRIYLSYLFGNVLIKGSKLVVKPTSPRFGVLYIPATRT